MKDNSEPFFHEQVTILERAIPDCLDAGHVARPRVIEALEKIKAFILQRESAMVNDHPFAMGGAPTAPERDRLADAAFRRMVRSSRHKITFDPALIDADVPTDEVFAHNLLVVMHNHVGLCQRIVTSDIEEVAALASITRESFALLRGAFPAGDPALQSLAERDAAFETEITSDEECMEYIEPLLAQRSLTGIGVSTPHHAHRPRLTEENNIIPSLSLSSSIPMSGHAPDAEPKRQNLTPEEKSAVQKNIKSLIDEHTFVEIVRRIREKGEYSDGAVKQAIRKAKKGVGLSPKYVNDIADIFGADVVSGACRTETTPTG